MAFTREQRQAYRKSEAGQAAERRYRQSARGKALAAARVKRFLATPKGIEWKRRNAWKYRIKQNFGLTAAEWTARLIEQAGRCAICGDPMRDPFVDHDHVTGAVRDLLCPRCNGGLAAFERPGFPSAATAYLERHKSNP